MGKMVNTILRELRACIFSGYKLWRGLFLQKHPSVLWAHTLKQLQHETEPGILAVQAEECV